MAAAAAVKLSLMFYSNNKKLHSHLHSDPAPIISSRAREDLILHVPLILSPKCYTLILKVSSEHVCVTYRCPRACNELFLKKVIFYSPQFIAQEMGGGTAVMNQNAWRQSSDSFRSILTKKKKTTNLAF